MLKATQLSECFLRLVFRQYKK